MMFWILLFSVLLLLTMGGSVYLAAGLRRFPGLRGLGKGLGLLAGLCVLWAATAVLWVAWGMVNAVVCMLHLLAIWLLCDGGWHLLAKLRKKPCERYWAGVTAIGITVCCLAWGWYGAAHVRMTQYELETEKPVGALRIAMLSDAHVGTTFHGAQLSAYLREIEKQEPDVLLVVGDFVDDDTTRADMEAACQSLGTMQTKFGTYFVFGNHDKGYFGTRGYTGEDLRQTLEKNGVRVLEDEAVLLDNRFYLIGRADKSGSRAAIEALTQGLDRDKYLVVLDHQPGDYQAEEEAQVDLVFSGHTHGGQFSLAAPIVGLWNDAVYGLRRQGHTDFIVSSGIADWALKFRTGHGSEYVITEVRG